MQPGWSVAALMLQSIHDHIVYSTASMISAYSVLLFVRVSFKQFRCIGIPSGVMSILNIIGYFVDLL
jgi:hypothetical protein